MNGKRDKTKGRAKRRGGSVEWLIAFPAAVAVVYAALAFHSPKSAVGALAASGRILLQIAPALVMVFAVMVVLNLLVTPAHIRRFLGKTGTGKGLLLSIIAGILSMGPIYAWYPLLKDLREKGVSDLHLATFLGCRAVKLPLLPIMAAYFGWAFTGTLTALMVLAAAVTGLAVNLLTKGGQPQASKHG